MKMKSVQPGVALILVIALTLAGCGQKPNSPAPPLPVTVETVGAGASSSGGAYSGNIVGETQVDLAFKVSGYVNSILQVKDSSGQMRNVQAGDPVTMGSVLATIKDDQYQQELLRAKSNLEGARAVAMKAQNDFTRYTHLLKEHVVAQAEYDAVKQQTQSAQASMNASKAAMQHAQVDLDDCKLKTPITGLVLDRKIEIGTLVSLNSVGFQVGNTDKVKVVFGVPGSIVGSIRPGTEISITTDALPHQNFKGTITKVAAAADPNSRVFDVEATIPNSDRRLRVGMIAALHLPNQTEVKSNTAVPMRSVVRPPDDPTGYAVYVVEEQDGHPIARLKKIAIGPVLGDQVSVESGLNPGARLIVKGSDVVYDGQQVSIIP